MARFQDKGTAELEGWIHELARAELNPESDRLFGANGGEDPHQVIEESTVKFLTELREALNAFAQTFNSYSEGGQRFSEIKIYSVAQTAADFMMFRNQIKLVVSNTAHGVVMCAFSQHVPGSISGMNQPISSTQEFLAHLGPFKEVSWTFQGEKVTPVQVAKFFFNEFVRTTRDPNRSRAGNQQLLKQIKALLQEKGLSI